MSIKLRVFCLMSLPTIFVVAIQFIALVKTYNLSLSLIASFSDNLYLDQQRQLTELLGAYSFEFNKLFQRQSQNLQIFNGLESKILRGEVYLSSTFIKPKGNIEKFFLKTENPNLQTVARRNSDLVSSWTTATVKDEDKLSSISTNQLKVSSYSEFLSKVIKLENSINSANPRGITINAIYEGFANDGMISTVSYNNRTYSTYVPPIGCTYTGPYKYDSRCRQWFLEPINRVQVTPIEPQLFFDSPNNPSLASNLCKRQSQYLSNSNGTITGISCEGYSVNCMTFKLSFIRQFFETVNFKGSKTIMIDPRSQKVVYNSISGMPKSITYLSAAIKDIFPSDNKKQQDFLQELQQKISRQISKKTDTTSTTNGNASQQCDPNSMDTQKQLLGLPSIDYNSYSQIVNQISYADQELVKQQHNAKSFIFKASDGEEVFVTINAIVIIEKFKQTTDNSVEIILNNQVYFELQDLFLVIDILPKKLLTTWTDKLIQQIHQYLLYFEIATAVLCVVFLFVTGIISYQVCLMIEVPIIHMTNLLKKFQEEGEGQEEGEIGGKGSVVLSLIEEQEMFQDEMVFLSLDVKILFESFICIFRMVHLATQDIFTVDSSHSLLQLNYQINFFRQFRNTRVLGICYNNIGNIHFQNKRYLESMENYQQALIFAYYEQGMYAQEVHKGLSSNSQTADAVLDVIFSRKLNFSQALYMHNVSQTFKENNGLIGNIRVESMISTIMIDWEVYETVLLQLIEINKQFTEFSYGRSVILCCQLSVCYLKMNQFEKAIQCQGQAIADYEVTLLIKDIGMRKNKSHEDEDIKSNSPKRGKIAKIGLGTSEPSGKIKEIQNSNKQNSSFRDDSKPDFLTEQLETRRISSEKSGLFEFEEEKDRISKFNQFQTKQGEINNTNRNSINQNNSNSNNNHNYNNKPEKIQNQQNLEGQIFRSIIKKRTKLMLQHGCQFMKVDDSLNGNINEKKNQIDLILEANKNDYQNQLSNEINNSNQKTNKDNQTHKISLSKQSNFRQKETSILSKFPNHLKILNTQGQLLQFLGNIENKKNINQSQNLRTSIKSNGQTIGSVRNIQTSRNHIKSPNLLPLNNRVISVSAYHRTQQSLSNTNQQPITDYDYLKRYKQISSISYKSMVNKNLLQEDLQQIQRFELPNDVLLSKIAIQEAKILMQERKYFEASLVLTELLEKTKFYLPFDRLKNLSILEEILRFFEVNASSLKKMIKRFDENIIFNVSTVLAVRKEHTKAASTCVYLVNEVLTNERDKFSLMVYSQNSFEQAIPSVQIKQLRSIGELINQIIEDYSGGFSNCGDSNEDISFSNNISQSRNLDNNNGNSEKNRKDISMNCMSPNIIITRSRKLPSQDDVQMDQQPISQTIQNSKQHNNKHMSLNGKDQIINSPQLSKNSDNNNNNNNNNNNTNNSPLIRRCLTHFSQSEETKQQKDFDPGLSPIPILESFPLSFLEFSLVPPTKTSNNDCNIEQSHEPNQVILSPSSQTSPFSQRQQTSVTEDSAEQDSLAEMFHQNSLVSQSRKTEKHKNSQFYLNQKTISSPRMIYDLSGNIDTLMAYTSQDCIDSSRSKEDKQNNQQQKQYQVNSQESQRCLDDGLLSPETQPQDMQISVNGQQQQLPFIQKKQSALQIPINVEDLEQQADKVNRKQQYLCVELENEVEEQQISKQIHQGSQDKQCANKSQKLFSSNHYEKFPLGSIRLLQSEKIIKNPKQSASIETSCNLSKANINFVFHFALRKAILGYFGQNNSQYHIQKRLTELNSINKSRKFIVFITDQTGIIENNQAYYMLTRLLYQAQIQLLVLQLQFEESLQEKNEINDYFIENKPVIKYFYTQEKMLQYIRNKREPMKNFGIPLLVEHFQV